MHRTDQRKGTTGDSSLLAAFWFLCSWGGARNPQAHARTCSANPRRDHTHVQRQCAAISEVRSAAAAPAYLQHAVENRQTPAVVLAHRRYLYN